LMRTIEHGKKNDSLITSVPIRGTNACANNESKKALKTPTGLMAHASWKQFGDLGRNQKFVNWWHDHSSKTPL
jgi:hypothetical protein